VAPENAPRAPRAKAAPGECSRRLFFALWPDESMRQALARATCEAARASGGRPVRTENLHVTLAFLGSVPESRVPELAGIGREAAGPSRPSSLDLAFDHLEHWRAAQLLCALPAAPPAAVSALASRLYDGLAKEGFAPDLKPFRPHVTVARKVLRPGPLAAMVPVAWCFTELALIESRTLPAPSPVSATGNASGNGALYSVVERYPLGSGPAGSAAPSNAANNNEKP
jgi:RNA 2',3'-cyclic 3'-phosphodiesterase